MAAIYVMLSVRPKSNKRLDECALYLDGRLLDSESAEQIGETCNKFSETCMIANMARISLLQDSPEILPEFVYELSAVCGSPENQIMVGEVTLLKDFNFGFNLATAIKQFNRQAQDQNI